MAVSLAAENLKKEKRIAELGWGAAQNVSSWDEVSNKEILREQSPFS